ncbi:hypothetical protein CQY21_20175 [Mycolicibacterium boenickei]|uniref:Uncharacterized protein n=1 Tax=Mycolicibacterium boenickei TaxID=146017 RepID=A0ABM7INN5_9MYCO|nr:hypothetical protein CQY21_20175 [Mycolicibacterium boenickei]BBX88409.1 hypothetical protein MBOE_00580 [Mycolicibacterium boenickei]
MARIRSLKRDDEPARPPRTAVDCTYGIVYADDGTKLLRLATLGSDMRKSVPKPSQIIEIDATIARDLIELLRTTFPGSDKVT